MKTLLSTMAIWVFCLCVAYGQSKVLVIGEQTPLQTELIGKRKTDKKQIQRQAAKGTQAPKAVQLSADIEEVHVNAAGFAKGSFAKNPHLRAAMDKKLPIVVENVKKQDLEQLTGFGADAKTVVVQSMKKQRGVHITIIEAEEQITDNKLKTSPPGLAKLNKSPENLSITVDTSKLSSEQLRKMRKMEPPKAVSNKPIRPKQQPQIKTQSPPTLKERSSKTKEAIQKIKTQKASGFEQGYVPDESTDYYVSNNPMFMTKRDLDTESSVFIAGAAYNSEKKIIQSVPDHSKYYIDFSWLKGWHSQSSRVDVSYDIWLYATTQPAAKYMSVTSKGRVHPGTLQANESDHRGYFTEYFWQRFGVSSNGILERSTPQNANDKTNVAVTTGWTVGGDIGGNAGVSSTGPSAGLSGGINGSYSETNRIARDIPDFKVTNHSDSRYTSISYAMSKCDGGEYEAWWSLRHFPFLKHGKVHGVPTWATSNMYPYAEGVWKFDKDFNESQIIKFTQYHLLRRVEETKNSIWDADWETDYDEKYYDMNYSISFSRVQIPHMGTGESSSQSSTSSGGHASRAIDGKIDGFYWNGSVTHTANTSNPWWQVDLGSDKANIVIQNIDIWNRVDCCMDHLKKYFVFVSDVPFNSDNVFTILNQAEDGSGNVSAYEINNGDRQLQSIPIGRTGRYVRVQLLTNNPLSLAEVRIVAVGAY